MFLSRVQLNPARVGTRKYLSSPQVVHAAVMSAFPPGGEARGESRSGRVLWRIDRRDMAIDLYVVSPVEPDFTHIVEQAGWPTTTAWTTRKYAPLLDRLTVGQQWHFRLTANPVLSTSHNAARGRPRLSGLDIGDQMAWLERKSEGNGFRLGTCGGPNGKVPDVVISDRSGRRFRRGRATVTLSTATFEGTLLVSDPPALRSALVNGIGRAKGYGCGLMTLAPTT
ncbi:type I-E CRISPR-associated protein Cas6/Cse3/CasE [Nocardia cyriacigeorgica]|uniref:type I-E CRISPR-associated protein Cas6/Cse3/CasE n=1 Tax=Nocardia cyriacigeorgica TaxID=135487 RepID=UPI0013B85A41|nr:type I-E CRISPR-associated protein Cas6/Cse3/CasE [Nocardia cyriacigeorgica]NEW51652.1 type I-E CRISPR-associated protein Cas6/Cse3/CasE [Nocardia cyriacigeorgica]